MPGSVSEVCPPAYPRLQLTCITSAADRPGSHPVTVVVGGVASAPFTSYTYDNGYNYCEPAGEECTA